MRQTLEALLSEVERSLVSINTPATLVLSEALKNADVEADLTETDVLKDSEACLPPEADLRYAY